MATVADKTFAVTFGDPAELGEDALFDAGAAEIATLAVVVTGGAFASVTFAAAPLTLCALLTPFVTFAIAGFVFGFATALGAMSTFIADDGAIVTAAGFTFDATVGFAAGIATAPAVDACPLPEFPFCIAGTAPVPGVPIPGNTVPCCRLPSLGCVADGVAAGVTAVGAAAADVAGCFSGKLIGGNLGGTGIGAGATLALLAAG